MKDNKWDSVAKEILRQEKLAYSLNYPKPTGVLIQWKGYTYIGSFQDVASKFSKEIVLLSKSSAPIDNNLADVIRKLDKERIELYADNLLDLDGRQHVVRKLGNKITFMTPEQTKYMIDHPLRICEI